ncbi:hypothetical protein ES703_54625 [subsurface metagenome]
MPERKIVRAHYQEIYDQVVQLLDDGWILDPNIYKGAPMRLEEAIVYHLIKFSQDELAAKAKEKTLEPQIVDIKKVPHDEVEALVKQGYKVETIYAKDVVLVKTGILEKTT